MTQNLHVCAICFRPEVVYDVISSQNVKTMEAYLVVNFEVASCNTFRDIKKIISLRRRRRRLTIALSENAFAFRLKIVERHHAFDNKCYGIMKIIGSPPTTNITNSFNKFPILPYFPIIIKCTKLSWFGQICQHNTLQQEAHQLVGQAKPCATKIPPKAV